MRPAATIPQGVELDTFIRAYEAAWACGEPVNVKEFLPEPGHPLYGSVLREVVRADLEYHWAHGQPRPLEEYRSSFPELFCDRESLCDHLRGIPPALPGGRACDAGRIRESLRRGRDDLAEPAPGRGRR